MKKKFTTKIILTSIIVLLIISNIITICYIYSLKLKEEKCWLSTVEFLKRRKDCNEYFGNIRNPKAGGI